MSDLTIDDMKRTFDENTNFLKIMKAISPRTFRSMIDPYAPCHCQSGKKYKFCCYKSTTNIDSHFKA